MRLRVLFVRFGLAALIVLFASTTFAQARKGLADTLTGDAKAAYVAARLLLDDGDYAGAEIKFKAAYDLSNDPRLLWNMAACEKSQRHYARTEQLVRDYLEKGGATLTEQDRADAKSLLDTIDSFTVKLTITVTEPDAEVLVDDVSIGKSPLTKPVVVDIGSRKIVVRKDGFKDFEQQVPVGGSATAKLDVKLEARVHEGHILVSTLPGAEIFLDRASVGRGRYEAKVKSGGHTLRVVAAGMRPYQSEIVITDDESRTIDVPLEHEQGSTTVYVAPPPKPWSPGGEIAFSMGPGAKLNADGAAFYDFRLEIGVKPGWTTQVGFIVDLGTIDPSNNCGSFYPRDPASPIDARYAFKACLFVKPGLQFAIHFMPRGRFDPYVSIEGGFRFGMSQYDSYDPLTSQTTSTTIFSPGVDAGGRIGLDYRPLTKNRRWSVGGFASVIGTIVADEKPHNDSGNVTPPINTNDHGVSYAWLLFGIRTSLIF